MNKQILVAGAFLVLAGSVSCHAQVANKPLTSTPNTHSIMQEKTNKQTDTTAQTNDTATYKLKKTKMEEGVVKAYKAVENGTVSAYKAVENGVVKGYKKVEDAFVNAFLEKVDSTAATNTAQKETETNSTENQQER